MAIIHHHRFTIRKFVFGDADAIAKFFSHPIVLRNVRGYVSSYTRADAKRYLSEKLRQYRRAKPRSKPGESDSLAYAIEINGALAGGVGLTVFGHKAEIGYWLAKPYWGQGIMTDVIRAFTSFGVRKFKLRRVEAKVFPFNAASSKVLEKNRFQLEGRLRKDVRVGKKFLDHLLYAKVW